MYVLVEYIYADLDIFFLAKSLDVIPDSYITYADSTQTFIMTDLSISCFEWKIWLYDIFDEKRKCM